jgi:hypothetical protein
MKKYDLYVHTKYHKTSVNKPSKILRVAKKRGLDGIAIMDSNLKGALAVSKLNKDKDFEVIVGQEVIVEGKKLLCYYIKKEIKSKTIKGVIVEVHKQKGFVAYRGKTSKTDAIFAYSAKAFLSIGNVFSKTQLPKIGGSDADFSFEIGEGLTLFEGNLRKAIKNKKTKATGTCINAPFGFIGRLFVWLFKIGLRCN